MVYHYVNFGYPDTVLVVLAGFDLEGLSPVDGMLKSIIVDSPSEFVGIVCRINEMQILPQEGELTIRTAIEYPINRRVNQKDRLVVELDNHDDINPHTPSMVWKIDDEIEREIGEMPQLVRKVKDRVADSWTTPSKEGTPDYQDIVYRGSVTDRIVLNANEAVVRLGLLMNPIASVYPHYKVPLPSGNTYNVVDLGTGVDTPWTCPVGFTFTILSYWWGFNQPCNGTMYMDGFLVSSLDEDAYRSHYEHDIFEDYNPLDPTGLFLHTMDFQLTNMGTVDMSGYYMCIVKLREVGTDPYPDDKEVKCIHCGHLHRVDRRAGKVACPVCKGETTYMPFLFGREIYK